MYTAHPHQCSLLVSYQTTQSYIRLNIGTSTLSLHNSLLHRYPPAIAGPPPPIYGSDSQYKPADANEKYGYAYGYPQQGG